MRPISLIICNTAIFCVLRIIPYYCILKPSIPAVQNSARTKPKGVHVQQENLKMVHEKLVKTPKNSVK